MRCSARRRPGTSDPYYPSKPKIPPWDLGFYFFFFAREKLCVY
nr:MAG TPA: hypothetical protein [Caudoviricetes sp.]